MICWRCGGKHYSTANVRYGTKACTVQCHCTKCGKDDHSTEHHDIYSDVQERRAARGAKAMAATSTQSDAPGHLFCLMARVATTTSTSLVASESLTLLLEEDDRDAKDSSAACRARLALKLRERPDGWVSEILSKAISHLSSTSNLPTFNFMARVATTTSKSLVASESLTLLLEEDDGLRS